MKTWLWKNSIVGLIAAAVGMTSLVTKGRAEVVSANPSPSVLAMEVIPRTPERLARGKYLVEGLLWCGTCHSDIDWTKRPLQVVPGTKFGGHVFKGDLGLPAPYLLVAPNISPDPKYGTGKWQDVDFVRALRRGIGHDGRALIEIMPSSDLSHLSDEDLASVIVYVRSLSPVHRQMPKAVLPEWLTKGLEPLPPVDHVPEPDRSDRVNYGKYLVTAGGCGWCHTPLDDHGGFVAGTGFSGGHTFTGPLGPNGARVEDIASLNLTPDPSGLSYFDEALFIKSIRSGQVGARPLSDLMPWGYFRNLTDNDLKAIFAYLRTLKPIKHRVDNTEPPTYCKLCRNKHGLGNMN